MHHGDHQGSRLITMREPRHPVLPHDLELLLSEFQALPGNNNEGFFGPGSITWQINRESAVFLGAGRAALLQLAHPWVAAALQQHSTLMHDAIARFHSTFRVIYTMLFGTRAQALAASRQLYAVHTYIQGELPVGLGAYSQGEHYEANEITALRWVYATLVESAVLAHDFVLAPLSASARESYYRESHRMAALCGIPSAMLPPDWTALTEYTAEMMSSPRLAVDNQAMRMGQAVLSGVGTWVRAPLWYRALTASWLPPHLRQEFDLTFGADEEHALDRARRWLPRLYPQLPKALRFVGPFREAQDRLKGKPPGRLIRLSNQFWMGRPRLLYAQAETADASARSNKI